MPHDTPRLGTVNLRCVALMELQYGYVVEPRFPHAVHLWAGDFDDEHLGEERRVDDLGGGEVHEDRNGMRQRLEGLTELGIAADVEGTLEPNEVVHGTHDRTAGNHVIRPAIPFARQAKRRTLLAHLDARGLSKSERMACRSASFALRQSALRRRRSQRTIQLLGSERGGGSQSLHQFESDPACFFRLRAFRAWRRRAPFRAEKPPRIL